MELQGKKVAFLGDSITEGVGQRDSKILFTAGAGFVCCKRY